MASKNAEPPAQAKQHENDAVLRENLPTYDNSGRQPLEATHFDEIAKGQGPAPTQDDVTSEPQGLAPQEFVNKAEAAEDSPPTSKCCCRIKVLTCSVGVLAAIILVIHGLCYLLGATTVLLSTLFAFWLVYLRRERLLGKLVGWVIYKIPKQFVWTMDKVFVKPSWSWRADSWGEVGLTGWTWWNPLDFECPGGKGWFLQIDHVTARIRFGSILDAVRYRKSIEIDFLCAEGLRVNFERDKSGALNLWEILALLDDDVNIKALLYKAREHGGLGDVSKPENKDRHGVQALPPISTTATRKAANFTKPEWATTQGDGSLSNPLLPKNLPDGYTEYAIGDPRRRPRWGVPLRLDIRQLVAVDLKVWVLDFILLDTHNKGEYNVQFAEVPYTDDWAKNLDAIVVQALDLYASVKCRDFQGNELDLIRHRGLYKLRDSEKSGTGSGATVFFGQFVPYTPSAEDFPLRVCCIEHDTCLTLSSADISRDRFEWPDPRRSGEVYGGGAVGDGIHGLYLGEIIWTIIAVAIPYIINNSRTNIKPLLMTGAFGGMFGIQDLTKKAGAKAIEGVLAAEQSIRKTAMQCLGGKATFHGADDQCRLKVHLMGGERFTDHNGHEVNVFVKMELLGPGKINPDATIFDEDGRIDSANSDLKLWTKKPTWDSEFWLGPLNYFESTLLVSVYHCTKMKKEEEVKLGEVRLAIQDVLLSDAKGTFTQDTKKIGIYPLRSDIEGSTARIKIGLSIDNRHLLKHYPEEAQEVLNISPQT